MNESDLLELKQEISEARGKAAELKGQRTILTKQLKEKWGVTTPKEGKDKLQTLQTEIDKKEQEIEKRTEELEKQLHNEENNTSN
jgi:hypothetical protein